MRNVVIASAVRTAFGRSKKGSFRDTRPDTLGGLVIKEALDRVPGLKPEALDDVIMGCAMPEAEQGMNVARISSALAGIPYSVPAMTINRFCSSGVQSMAIAADSIRSGSNNIIVAGGTETMTMLPMGGNKITANPLVTKDFMELYTPMGTTAEIVAKRFEVSREDQDAFAMASHQKAAKAWSSDVFKEEVIPFETTVYLPNGGSKTVQVAADECVRPGTDMAGLGRLRPAFNPMGTVTAGNASPLTDGAGACVLMGEDIAESMGVSPLGYFRQSVVVGVDPDIMGIGPVPAIRKLLAVSNLDIKDIDVFEINEAFAAQSVYCLRELGLTTETANRQGGAIAIGHPLGATGARLAATVLYQLKAGGGRYGIVSMCIGGGMGFAALLEVK